MILFVAAAQAEPDLGAYMDAAVAHHPRADVALANLGLARAEATAAGAALLPTASVRAAYTYNQYETEFDFPGVGTVTLSPKEQLDASLTARLPLVNAPAWAAWLGQRRTVVAAEHDLAAAERDLRIEVARAWFGAVAAQEVVVAAERALEVARENARYVQMRESAGAATPVAVQRAELEIANAEALRIEGLRGRAVAGRLLASLTGLPEPDALPVVPATLEAPTQEEELLAQALAQRPELAAAAAREERAALARGGAALGWAPTLDAFVSERYSNASGFTGESASWSLGLELNWQILDVGRRVAEAQRARASLDLAQATSAEAELRVRDDLQTAWLDVDLARARLVAARRAAEVAQLTTRDVRARFQAGTATQLEVVQADRDALDAEVRRIRAEGELGVARLELDRAAGRPIGGG